MPWDSMSAMCMLRIWLCRSAFTLSSPVSPSTPQFHEKLSLEPSLQSAGAATVACDASQCLPYEQDRQVEAVKQLLIRLGASVHLLMSWVQLYVCY